jgi:hypothetical protein
LAFAALVGIGSVGLVSCASAGITPTGARTNAKTGSPDQSDEWPVTECGTVDGKGCAPTRDRVDLVRPTFSNPTDITNPLFPVSKLDSVVQVGTVDGKPFRSETTTLPNTGVVNWYGEEVRVVLSQYTAYLDGKIEEVAIDRYAQADDGSVWYFGEDVIDYVGGTAYFTEGTWLAGRDGPPSMVMPAHPRLGDVFRVENVIGIVFEELTVVRVNKTLPGPNGPVHGAIVVDELGVSGGHSRKTLTPGYGEFLTRGDGELEAMAVAAPTNAIPGGAPLEVRKALTAAWGTFEYARAQDWPTVNASVTRIADQVAVLKETQQPPRVMALLRGSLASLEAAARAHDAHAAEQASIDVAQSAIDLEARYLPAQDVEVARFHLHTQQLRVSAAVGQPRRVMGEVAALEWISDRLDLNTGAAAQVDQQLAALRVASDAGNLAAAADLATRLASMVRDLTALEN